MSDLFKINPMETQVSGLWVILKGENEKTQKRQGFPITVSQHEADFIKSFLWSGLKQNEKEEWFRDFLEFKDEIFDRRKKSTKALHECFLELKKDILLKADEILLPRLYIDSGWCCSIHSLKGSAYTSAGCGIFLSLIKENTPTFVQVNLTKKELVAYQPHVKLRHLSPRPETKNSTLKKKNGNRNGKTKKSQGKHPRRDCRRR